MKKLLFILSVMAVLMVSCAKEDDIRPIVVETDTLGVNKCLIGGDTVSIGDAVRFEYYDVNYYFYDQDGNLLLHMMSVDELFNPDNSEAAHPCVVYYGGDTLTFHYSVVCHKVDDVYHIQAQGFCAQDSTLKMQLNYQNSIFNINQYTGKGFLSKDADTIPLTQLTYNQSDSSCLMFDSKNIETYSLGRIKIQGDLHSGLFDLSNSHAIQVFYEIGIPGTCPGVRSYPIVSGQLQYSYNNGKSAIILHGETEHWKIDMEYDGSSLNANEIPLSW